MNKKLCQFKKSLSPQPASQRPMLPTAQERVINGKRFIWTTDGKRYEVAMLGDEDGLDILA